MVTTRSRRWLGWMALGLLVLPALPQTARAGGGSAHPYFSDQGTLAWYDTLREARRAADREGKLIFVEYGRRACTQCKRLCTTVLPHPSVRQRLGAVAVGLAAECDSPEPAVSAVFRRNLRNARMLPFAAFLTSDGRWITGFAGACSVPQFLQHLAIAERVQGRLRAPPARPAPAAPRAPTPPPVVEPTPAPEPEPSVAPESDGDDLLADAHDCPGGQCQAGGPLGCPPVGPPPTPAPSPCDASFPAPAPRLVASAAPTAEPSAPAPIGYGSPDAEEIAPALAVALPPPVVGPATRTTVAEAEADATARPQHGRRAAGAPITQASRRDAAVSAAARGDWGAVIRNTREVGDDAELGQLNRRAHAWAHGVLASAVVALREGRVADAQHAVEQVTAAMAGEPEAVDARRGAEAIERMEDLRPLAEESELRAALRKTAYERMRGSRWAPLFSECPAPSRTLSQR